MLGTVEMALDSNGCMILATKDAWEGEYYKAVMDRQEGIENNFKPMVLYRPYGAHEVVVGLRAMVIPLNHQSIYVTNGLMCHTSTVVAYDEATGNFETKNTKYILAKGTN